MADSVPRLFIFIFGATEHEKSWLYLLLREQLSLQAAEM